MSVTEKDINMYKSDYESRFVGCLYQDTDLFYEYENVKGLLTNKQISFYYSLLKKVLVKNEKINEDVIEVYVNAQKEEARNIYKQYGGYDVIDTLMKVSELDNVQSYYSNILKYDAIQKLHKIGFPILKDKEWEKIAEFTYEQIADRYESQLDNIFSQDTAEDEIGDIKDGIEGMIEQADKGANKGFPVTSKILNATINGQVTGNITMLAASSGSGKSFLSLTQTLPMAIDQDEPLLIMCNEEDMAKWQRELITWVINNVICKNNKKFRDESFIKSRFYQGHFTDIEWQLLKEAQAWIDKKVESGLIRFINFRTFSMGKTIKLIKKFSKREVKYFIIDTLKLDNDAKSNVNDQSWLQLQQNMVKLYNVIKESNQNVHVWVTYQMSKSKSRFLDQSMLGISKNVADVVSTLMLTRKVLLDEKSGGKNELKVENAKGDKVNLDPTKDYRILFIDKNRMGSSSKQIVLETDMSKNIVRDMGYTYVPEDY